MKLFKSLKYLDVRNIYKDTFGDNTPGKIIEKIKPIAVQKTAELIEELKAAREKLKDIPGTNYKLGEHHLKNGNIDDAILRFKMVIYLAPQMAEAYYNLGRCLLIKGENDEARENLLKAISLKPEFPEAVYIIDKINSPENLNSIPVRIIAEHQEGKKQSGESKDLIDKSITTTLLANISDKNPNLEVLDLGCGKGGRGIILRNREVIRKLTGVDINIEATKIAASEKFHDEPVYNSISNDEVSFYLKNNQEKFDVVIAGNIFQYHKSLEDIFSNIAKALKTNGIFAVIVEKNDIEENYRLDIGNDKFLHSMKYCEHSIKNTGFLIHDEKYKDIEGRKFNIIIARIAGN